MVPLSEGFNPLVLRGIQVHPDNPFRFNFLVDSGDTGLEGDAVKAESSKLIKYFLASLTIPEQDLWVNLSPYEKDRIIPGEFGETEMGRDLLAQDYLLKQITATLIYPEDKLGQEFWQKVYAQAQEKYGTAEIPINTFNKVWIVPDKAVVYENEGKAFVLKNHLKVMLEQDYLALENNKANKEMGLNQQSSAKAEEINNFSSNVVREIVLPALEKEVNEGKNFAQLRQVFYSLILATWYKTKIRESILKQLYIDQKKIGGVELDDKTAKEKIYQQYVEAFKKGVYNYIKEDYDPVTQETIPRKYFSGGVVGHFAPESIAYVGPRQISGQDATALSSTSITNIEGDVRFLQQGVSTGSLRHLTKEETASLRRAIRDAVIGKTNHFSVVLTQLPVNSPIFRAAIEAGKAQERQQEIDIKSLVEKYDLTKGEESEEKLLALLIQPGQGGEGRSDQAMVSTPSTIKDFYELAQAIHKSPTIELANFVILSRQGVINGIDAYETLLKELDEQINGHILEDYRDQLEAFKNKIINVEFSNKAGRVRFIAGEEEEAKQAISAYGKAIANFREEFRAISVFEQALAQLHVSEGKLKDPQVQATLDKISRTRRNVWRLLEHFASIVDKDPSQAWGIINPSLDLNQLLRTAVDRERQLIPYQFMTVNVQFELDGQIPKIIGDETRLMLGFREVIRNAVLRTVRQVERNTYIPFRSNSQVVIRTEYIAEQKAIKITITDNGIGMDAEQIQNISFYGISKSDYSNGVSFGGHGFGYPIMLLSLSEHGGKVAVDSNKETGTKITATLPVETINKEIEWGAPGTRPALRGSSSEESSTTEADSAMISEQRIANETNRESFSKDQLGEKPYKLFELQRAGFNVPRFFVIKSNGSGKIIFDDQLRQAFGGLNKPVIVRSVHPEEGKKYSYSGVFESYPNIKILSETEASKTVSQQLDGFEDIIPESLEGAYQAMVLSATESYKLDKYKKAKGVTEFDPNAMNAVVMEQVDIDVFGMFVTSDQQNPDKVSIFFEVRGDENKGLGGVIIYDKKTRQLEPNQLSERLQKILLQFGETAAQIEEKFDIQQIELASSKQDGKVYVFQSRDINLGNSEDVPRYARYRTLDKDLHAIGFGSYRAPVLVVDALDEVSNYRRSEEYRKIEDARSQALRDHDESKAESLFEELDKLKEVAVQKYREELLEFQRTHSDYILVIKDADAVIDWVGESWLMAEKNYDFLNRLASKAKVVIRGKNQNAIRHEDWDHVELGGITILVKEMNDLMGVFQYRLPEASRGYYRDETVETANEKVVRQYSSGIATGDYLNVLSNTDGIFVWQDNNPVVKHLTSEETAVFRQSIRRAVIDGQNPLKIILPQLPTGSPMRQAAEEVAQIQSSGEEISDIRPLVQKHGLTTGSESEEELLALLIQPGQGAGKPIFNTPEHVALLKRGLETLRADESKKYLADGQLLAIAAIAYSDVSYLEKTEEFYINGLFEDADNLISEFLKKVDENRLIIEKVVRSLSPALAQEYTGHFSGLGILVAVMEGFTRVEQEGLELGINIQVGAGGSAFLAQAGVPKENKTRHLTKDELAELRQSIRDTVIRGGDPVPKIMTSLPQGTPIFDAVVQLGIRLKRGRNVNIRGLVREHGLTTGEESEEELLALLAQPSQGAGNNQPSGQSIIVDSQGKSLRQIFEDTKARGIIRADKDIFPSEWSITDESERQIASQVERMTNDQLSELLRQLIQNKTIESSEPLLQEQDILKALLDHLSSEQGYNFVHHLRSPQARIKMTHDTIELEKGEADWTMEREESLNRRLENLAKYKCFMRELARRSDQAMTAKQKFDQNKPQLIETRQNLIAAYEELETFTKSMPLEVKMVTQHVLGNLLYKGIAMDPELLEVTIDSEDEGYKKDFRDDAVQLDRYLDMLAGINGDVDALRQKMANQPSEGVSQNDARLKELIMSNYFDQNFMEKVIPMRIQYIAYRNLLNDILDLGVVHKDSAMINSVPAQSVYSSKLLMLSERISSKIHFDKDLRNLSTLKMQATAESYVEPSNEQELQTILKFTKANNIPTYILGNGSNVLFSPYVPGLIISLKQFRKTRVEGNFLYAEPGVSNVMAIKVAQESGLSGLEFSAGIPGTIGGLVVMNGNFRSDNIDQELTSAGISKVNFTAGDVVKSVKVIDSDGEIRELNRDELGFGYRESIFQHESWVILEVVFELQGRDQEEIKRLVSKMREIRDVKESRHVLSLGCVFCPRDQRYEYGGEKRTANWFIEQVGAKEWVNGGIYIDPKLPDHLLNSGEGTAEEFIALAKRIYQAVYEKFGVKLRVEIKSFPSNFAADVITVEPKIEDGIVAQDQTIGGATHLNSDETAELRQSIRQAVINGQNPLEIILPQLPAGSPIRQAADEVAQIKFSGEEISDIRPLVKKHDLTTGAESEEELLALLVQPGQGDGTDQNNPNLSQEDRVKWERGEALIKEILNTYDQVRKSGERFQYFAGPDHLFLNPILFLRDSLGSASHHNHMTSKTRDQIQAMLDTLPGVFADFNDYSRNEERRLEAENFVKKFEKLDHEQRRGLFYSNLTAHFVLEGGFTEEFVNSVKITQAVFEKNRAEIKEIADYFLKRDTKDNAQLSDTKGGIDFDPNHLNLEIQNKGKDFQFNIDPKAIENMHIDGAEFFIINTTPMINLPLFLGLSRDDANHQLSLKN